MLSGRVNHATRLPAAITASAGSLPFEGFRPRLRPLISLFRLNDVLLNDPICIIMLITQLYSSGGSEMWISTNKDIDVELVC